MSAVGSILTNQGALDALNSISQTSNTNNTLEQELSSGLSINSPADNPAGYITAQGFTSQINGLTQAVSNANQGVSLLQTAQGALQQQIGVVQQLNSIAVQAANGTQDPAEAESLQNVVTQLTGQVTTIASQTQFNNISLLNGTFSGVQFQVGANEGQTLSLSIDNTAADAIGLNHSSAATGSLFKAGTRDGVLSTLASAAATTGAFTAGSLKITGSNGETGTISGLTANESASAIATKVNDLAGTTGVTASAVTTITLKATAGTGAGSLSGFQFKLVGSNTSASASQTINAANISALVTQINGDTNATGITATIGGSASSKITLVQSNGKNIKITGATAGSLASSSQGTTATLVGAAAGTDALIQGQVQLQSSGSFSLGGSAKLGLKTTSTLTSLADVNVSTVAGANTAINVVKFALQGLNNQGGQLGAVQQRLTANINNLNTSSQNATSALGVVQDANIPAVSNALTQAQIQAQAGVAALKSSTTLQQSYLSLLP
jgi:flagellin